MVIVSLIIIIIIIIITVTSQVLITQGSSTLYNFIFNNCATRPRDVFERNVEGNISYPLSIQPITYREAIEIYTENAPWAKFAFDLCLGSHTDEVASERDLLFLPELLSESLSQSYIIKDGNKTK